MKRTRQQEDRYLSLSSLDKHTNATVSRCCGIGVKMGIQIGVVLQTVILYKSLFSWLDDTKTEQDWWSCSRKHACIMTVVSVVLIESLMAAAAAAGTALGPSRHHDDDHDVLHVTSTSSRCCMCQRGCCCCCFCSGIARILHVCIQCAAIVLVALGLLKLVLCVETREVIVSSISLSSENVSLSHDNIFAHMESSWELSHGFVGLTFLVFLSIQVVTGFWLFCSSRSSALMYNYKTQRKLVLCHRISGIAAFVCFVSALLSGLHIAWNTGLFNSGIYQHWSVLAIMDVLVIGTTVLVLSHICGSTFVSRRKVIISVDGSQYCDP